MAQDKLVPRVVYSATDEIARAGAKFKQYVNLTELGLTAPVTTQEIIDAMDDQSMTIWGSSGTQLSDLPDAGINGTLYIIKINTFRVVVEFTNADPDNVQKYIGDSYDGTFYGWKGLNGQLKETVILRTDAGGRNFSCSIYEDGTMLFTTSSYYEPDFLLHPLPVDFPIPVTAGSVVTTSNTIGGAFSGSSLFMLEVGSSGWRFYKILGTNNYSVRATISTKKL